MYAKIHILVPAAGNDNVYFYVYLNLVSFCNFIYNADV